MSTFSRGASGFGAGRPVPPKPEQPVAPLPAAKPAAKPAPASVAARIEPLGDAFAAIAANLDRDLSASRAADYESSGLVDVQRPVSAPDPFNVREGATAAIEAYIAASPSMTDEQKAVLRGTTPEALAQKQAVAAAQIRALRAAHPEASDSQIETIRRAMLDRGQS